MNYEVLPYLGLALAIIFSRLNLKIWFGFFIVAVVLAFWKDRIGILPIFSFLVFGIFGEFFKRKILGLGWLWVLGAAAVSTLIFLRMIPGFNNLNIFKGFVGSENAVPYSLWLNFDKPVVGLLLAHYFCSRKLVNLKKALGTAFSSLKICLVGSIVVYLLAGILGYVTWEPKLPALLVWWIPINLLGTCVAEEAIFRGLLQDKILGPVFKNRLSILLAALVFGAAHFAGGWKYILLASVAGIFYGWAYEKGQKSLEASVLCHFGLNLGHFLLLTYPALSPG